MLCIHRRRFGLLGDLARKSETPLPLKTTGVPLFVCLFVCHFGFRYVAFVVGDGDNVAYVKGGRRVFLA